MQSMCSLFAVNMFVFSFNRKSIETANKIPSPVNFLEVNIFLLVKYFSSCSPIKWIYVLRNFSEHLKAIMNTIIIFS